MKRTMIILAIFMLLIGIVKPVHAAQGNVTYDGTARQFIFSPGSEQSPTDLFPDFKDIMPGATMSQRITLKNNADKEVKVKIYLRALGGHKESEAFLSQLGLKVKKSDDNSMAYMFDAQANETAQLADWVCLGTLYSGGEVDLDVVLTVPAELGNQFQNSIGYLDWEFKVEELPVEESDPNTPQTGDETNVVLYSGLAVGSLILLIALLLGRKKKEEGSSH